MTDTTEGADMPDRTCAVDSCERKARSLGYCTAHYKRLKRTGSVGSAVIWDRIRDTCRIDDCPNRHSSRGLCGTHLLRWKKWGDPYWTEPPKTGTDHPHWVGAEAGYGASHERIIRARGRAAAYDCVGCGAPAQEWAYRHDDPDERSGTWAGAAVRYSTKPDHYDPMCRPCHRKKDATYSWSQPTSSP